MKKKMKTFKTFAFGCRVNQAEEEEIQKQMLNSGFSWKDEKPEIFIVNTCAVTDKAEREARQLIYQIKRESPKTFIVATGCATTNWQQQALLNKLPIDLPVNNLNKEYLVKLIIKKLKSEARNPKHETISNVSDLGFGISNLPNKYTLSGRYLLKIQDGCHRFCTFCIVPYLRGLPKSTPTKKIIEKINSLPNSIKEVILTAINTEAFGKDTGENFIDLLKAVLEKTRIQRLSFGSIHPWSIGQKFFAFYKKQAGNRLVDFFHIPLQSGSDKILGLMKRGYKRKEFEEKLFSIQKINPYALIGTDVIVGFLEETDKDFEDTYEFLKKVPISKFHVFRFSKKKKTAAYYLAKRLDEPSSKIKRDRSQLLIELSNKKYQKFQEKLVGRTFSCLFLPRIEENYQEGLLSNQVLVTVQTNKNLASEIKNVQVTQFRKEKLIVRLLD